MSREERERDLQDEIEAHLRMAERDRTERGEAPLEARRAVRREFGNVGLVKEVTRTMWGFQRLEELSKDCAYALRGLRRSPAFAAVAVVALALGLGANAAIFSLVDGVLLKPPPFPEPDRLVVVSEKPAGGGRNEASGMGFLDWRASSGSVKLAASAGRLYTLTGRGEPRRVLAQVVSAAFFDIFRVRAATGRTFLPQEDQPGKDRVAVISHRTWQTIIGGEPAIIGSTIRLEGNAYTVVGILPPQRFFERHWADVWLALALTPTGANRDFHYLRVYGRLEPGVTLASAQAELDAIGKRIANDFPATNKGIGILIEQLEARMVDPMLRQTLGVLLCAVGLVLLIACVNLANLLLARSSSRQRESGRYRGTGGAQPPPAHERGYRVPVSRGPHASASEGNGSGHGWRASGRLGAADTGSRLGSPGRARGCHRYGHASTRLGLRDVVPDSGAAHRVRIPPELRVQDRQPVLL